MAGTGITIDATVDDAQVRAALERLARKAADPAPALREIGEVLWISTRARFGTQTAPDGSAWAPNSAVTLGRMLAAKKGSYKKSGALSAKGAKRLGAKKPLTLTGILADTLARQLTAGGQGVEVGTNRVYGAVQQFGAAQGAFGRDRRNHPIPWGTIPARPYLGVSAQDRTDILRVLTDYLRP